MSQKTQRKLVLSICDISPTKFGSFEEFIIALTEKLKGSNFEHMIIFRDQPIKSVEDLLSNSGANIGIFKPTNSNILNLINIYKIIKENKPEIVHFHFYPVYSILNYLKYFNHVKIIHTDHMGGKEAKTFLKKVLRKIYYFINSKIFDIGIDSIVCVSNFVKFKYSKEYGINSTKLLTIYNGVNINKFQKYTEINDIKRKFNIKSEFVITCVGLRKDKGPHCLIKAAPLIIKEIPNTKFLLVGEGECKEYIESLIEKFSLKNNVELLGSVQNLTEIYSLSSCVVIPSLFEEAFCFVAAEAMATETSIVAFDSGAIKEILYNKENIISRSYKLLSEKIIESLKVNDISKNKSRDYVINNFSLDKSVSNYVELYEKLLN
jgi:L-malate glycosyltransferase